MKFSIFNTELRINGFPKKKSSIKTATIVIHDHTWINFNAMTPQVVNIGRSAIVATNSVIAKDAPEFTMVADNPAFMVKQLIPTQK